MPERQPDHEAAGPGIVRRWLSFGLTADAEDRYRQACLSTDIAQARVCIFLVLAVSLLFAVNDYGFLGLSWRFYGLQAFRVGLVVYTLLVVHWLSGAKDYRSYDRAEFAWGLVLVVFTITTAATRPHVFIVHSIMVVVCVFITVLAIPNRFVNQIIVSLAYTIGETLVIAPGLSASPEAGISVLLSMFLANAIAVACARQLHSWRRREFLAVEEELKAKAKALRQVAEREQAEAALSRAEERARNVIKVAPAAIYEMDFAGERFLSVNDTMCQVLGYCREELLAIRPRDLADEESLAAFQDRVRLKLAGADAAQSVEYRVRARDGRWVDALVNIGSFTYKDGRPDRVLVIGHDITARKRLERLYAVLSRVNETIVRTDDERALCQDVCRIVAEDGEFPLVWIGTVTGPEVRPIASSGSAVRYLDDVRVEVDGPLGSGPTGTCIREDRSVINSDFDVNPDARPWRQAALVHGFRASAAFPLHRAGQTVGALTLYATRPGAFDVEQVKLLDALSADVSYALEAMDRDRRRREAETALRESEHSLRESDQRKSEFLAVLSHELRNPLAPIRSSLYILERAVPASDQARRARAVLDRQVGHLSHLVDDLLDLTRITRNKIQLDRRVLDLNDLVRRTVEDHRTVFEKNGIHVAAVFTPERIQVKADPTRLVQVIGNLLQNAAKFTVSGGYTRVSVSLEQTEGRAVVRVSDTGIGIEPDVLGRLFEPFMQADTSLDRSKGGLGLGLALVKGLVDLHGGDVRAYSDGPGAGSEFVVRLPLAADEAVDGDVSRAGDRRSGRRVLIIEDNVDAADCLREVLEFDDHDVAVAYTGPQGLAMAREFRPEVVLCDIGLPGMDGFEVARALRADESLGSVFLVALSGYAMPDDLRRAAEAGFQEHLAKPPSPERLQELLRTYPTAADGLGVWRGAESGSA